MKLIIDGIEVKALPEQSLLDIIQGMGLVTGRTSTDPLAAKIAGRVFTLNYVPLRQKDITERESVRRAVAASDGVILRLALLAQDDTSVNTASLLNLHKSMADRRGHDPALHYSPVVILPIRSAK